MDSQGVPDLGRFYSLLAELEEGLGGKRTLGECHGRMAWPRRGVCFFFEPGEVRGYASTGHRVVRVGTHALKDGAGTTLWGRLRSHRGTEKGGGNHRTSIFRLHVGAALLNRDGRHEDFPTWGGGSSAPKQVTEAERPWEQLVSEYLGQMSLLWMAVEDDPGPQSDRALIERNGVALLARVGSDVDPPSEAWLGRHSASRVIRETGLWNVDHTEGKYDAAFLSLLAKYVRRAIRATQTAAH